MDLPPPPARRRRATPGRLPGELTARAFTALLPDLVRPLLPPDLADFAVRGPMFSLVGFYYGENPKVHYEVWVQRRLGLVEVGLHFEADAATNAAGFSALSEHAGEIVARLGPAVEGEPWTKHWARIHQNLPLQPLTPDFAAAVAERVAAFITVLEPLRRAAAE